MATEKNYIGIAMGLDVSNLKSGISEANKQIQLANSEFKKASSGMEDWTKSTDGLSAKITQLTTVLDYQKKKLAGMEAEYEKVVASQGESSEAARKLKVQMNNQLSSINATSRELNNFKETLEKAKKGEIDLEKVSLKSGKAIEKMGDQAKESGDGFTTLKGTIATFAGNVLTTLVSKTIEAGKAILGLAESTREYRQTLATLEAGATDVGVSTDFIKNKFTDLMGVFNDQDSVTEGLNNLLTAGFDESSLNSITTALEGASLKWKDTLKFEGLSDSLQEWIGSDGANLTGNFAELLERMGYNLKDVQAKTADMTDEQRRNYAVNILNSQGLNEVSEKYREQNSEMVEAQKANIRWQNTTAKAGAIIEPITTRIREGFTKIVEKLLELTQNINMEAFGASITTAFDTFVNDIIPKIVEGIQWIIDNKDTVLAGIVAIGSAFLAWKVVGIIQGIISAFKAWQLATQGLTVAQRLLNLVMAANPIGIIISLIAGLVAGFIYLWNTSDEFRQFWIDLWEDITKWCSKAWEDITDLFSGIGKWFTEKFNEAWEGMTKAFSSVGSYFSKKVDEIVGAFKNIKEKFLDTGKNIVKGIWDGIKDGAGWLKDKISGFAGDVAGWFKKTFKINSPSKLMADEVGLYVGQGIGEGVLNSVPSVKKDLNKFSGFVSDNLGGIKNGISSSVVKKNGSLVSNGSSSQATSINAGLTINYNGKLSRKEIKKTENNHYTALKTRLKMEGAI